MVRRLDELPDIDKDIIKILKTGRDRALTASEIKEKIEDETGGNVTKKEVYHGLSELIGYGSVRTVKVRKHGEEVTEYYLSRGIGSGGRNQAKLEGKANPFTDFYRLIKRITGAVLVLFSMGVLAYQGTTLSGAAISTADLINGNFILPLSLLILGGVLLFQSFKK